MKRSLGLLSVVMCFCCLHSSSQQFGAFPPSIKWKQINTDTVRIIFQGNVEPQAQKIAAIIHRIARENPYPLGDRLRKINTVLHSNTTMANGYVALAPFRSEYYLIPPSNIFELGANPWHEELAVHEYRHVQQFNNFKNTLTGIASVILGEEGQALLNGITVPDWFWEGDAVVSETALTRQGRGRLPNFFNGYNSLWREQRNYSWLKLRNGSMKDFVPSHYQLGYLLTNYGYLQYGPDFWKKVTQDATAFKGLFYPFQKAIERHAGVDFKTFRNAAIAYYSAEVSRKRTDVTERATVTNYYFPQFISRDSLLYQKSGYKNISAFYIKDQSGEYRLTQRNISIENWFSYRNGIIAYSSYSPDARWELRDYNNIYLYDIHTKQERKITSKAKYYTPDLSLSGKQIVSVFYNDSAEAELHVLKNDGEVMHRIRNVNGSMFVHPRFIDENSVVVAERLPNSMMTLNRIDINTGKREELIPPSYATIGFPFVYDNSVYFVSSAGGNDDIYYLRLKDRKIFQLATGYRGNYFPSVYEDSLTWSKFTSNGLQIQENALSALGGTEVTVSQWRQVAIPHRVAGADSLPNVLTTAAGSFPVTNYRQSAHLFNFHSWRPEYSDPEFLLRVFSDNVMNTFTNELFYRYNQNETSHGVGFNSYYGALFPVLTAGVEYTFDRTFRIPSRTVSFNTFEASAGAYVPLSFTGGKTLKGLTFGSEFVHNRTTPTGIYKDSFRTITDNYLSHFVNWAQQLPRALQHIYPKFGYSFNLGHRHLLSDTGFQFSGSTRLFLPSLGNHSIVLNAALQETDTSNVVFSNRFANSRGYEDYFLSRMWRLSGNYHMPLFYPDWGFGSIIYFLRVRSNFFYDFTRAYNRAKTVTRDLRSTGAEIYFDTKIWNSLPVTFGVRWSHLLDRDLDNRPAGRNVFEFIVPVDLVPR